MKLEQYLKEYIGEYFEISETSEKIYIGSDFPDSDRGICPGKCGSIRGTGFKYLV